MCEPSLLANHFQSILIGVFKNVIEYLIDSREGNWFGGIATLYPTTVNSLSASLSNTFLLGDVHVGIELFGLHFGHIGGNEHQSMQQCHVLIDNIGLNMCLLNLPVRQFVAALVHPFITAHLNILVLLIKETHCVCLLQVHQLWILYVFESNFEQILKKFDAGILSGNGAIHRIHLKHHSLQLPNLPIHSMHCPQKQTQKLFVELNFHSKLRVFCFEDAFEFFDGISREIHGKNVSFHEDIPHDMLLWLMCLHHKTNSPIEYLVHALKNAHPMMKMISGHITEEFCGIGHEHNKIWCVKRLIDPLHFLQKIRGLQQGTSPSSPLENVFLPIPGKSLICMQHFCQIVRLRT
mmetsp:Transcript_6512/g.24464  ORF Transcript_6512/g.24464 Transcript_6512/m.24464 type:complete len:350 (-) Transcript_6512:1229-2278(-)